MAYITLREYLQETEDAISANRVNDALTHCQYILASFPEALEAQRLLGEVYLAQGQLEDAQHAFDWVLTNDPEHVIAYCNRALVSERMGDIDTALDCYQQAYELSRGNSQIRQEFNQLSARVGQPGFMFSRAGLARLYMRGDLLTQATQEWEIVLAATPDRLDARTGLLETYWRRGMYDQVAQLAPRILQDVPSCEKALLLLAHVTAAGDLNQAQELLKRAEVVDPDLLMAQDLFADQQAAQPADPFWLLLQHPAARLNTDAATVSTQGAQNGAQAPAAVQDILAQWGSGVGWSNDATLNGTQAQEPSPLASSFFAAWSPTESVPSESWGNVDAPRGVTPLPDVPDLVAQLRAETAASAPWHADEAGAQSSESAEPWQLLQDALNGITPDVVQNRSEADPQPWEQVELPSVPRAEEHELTEDIAASASQPADTWSFPAPESNAPAPPPWLSMLTQADRHQMSGMMPVLPPEEPAAQPAVDPAPPPAQEQPEAQPAPSSVSIQAPSIASLDSADEESLPGFGPEWLKSIGAATLDDEEPAHREIPQEQPALEPEPTYDTWQPVPRAAESTSISGIWPAVAQDAPTYNTWQAPPREPVPTYDNWQPAAQEPEPSYDNWQPAAREPEPSYDNWQPAAREPEPSYNNWQPAAREADAEPTYDNWAPIAREPEAEPTYNSWQAATRDPEPAYEAWQPAAQEADLAYNSWQSQLAESQPEYLPSWSEQLSGFQSESTSDAAQHMEQNLVTTLEDLEKNLRSKGFIPLEPKSLSTIAQETQGAQSFQPVVPDEVEETVSRESLYANPVSPSALSQLGGYTQPSASTSAPLPPTVDQPVADTFESVAAEPSWLAALRAVPTPMFEPAEEVTPDVPRQEEPAPAPAYEELPMTARAPIETTPVFTPTAQPERRAVEQTSPAPVAQSNPFLDGELETTMKRPAVRLRSMQQQSSPIIAREAASVPQKARPAERTARKATSENLTYRERLLRGYQSQLVGDYDEAMQEYRQIIRNAPELLGEVVSNMRALLKLAPKYSAGHRVLGDAYMRQGEYLQAMESYNKALTMAKKARS